VGATRFVKSSSSRFCTLQVRAQHWRALPTYSQGNAHFPHGTSCQSSMGILLLMPLEKLQLCRLGTHIWPSVLSLLAVSVISGHCSERIFNDIHCNAVTPVASPWSLTNAHTCNDLFWSSKLSARAVSVVGNGFGMSALAACSDAPILRFCKRCSLPPGQ